LTSPSSLAIRAAGLQLDLVVAFYTEVASEVALRGAGFAAMNASSSSRLGQAAFTLFGLALLARRFGLFMPLSCIHSGRLGRKFPELYGADSCVK